MVEVHFEEPRNIAYDKSQKDHYVEWTEKSSESIFSGCNQADVFLLAMALGVHRERQGKISKKSPDIPTTALNEKQKWAILSLGVTDSNSLLKLKNEKPIYEDAELFAVEGIEILKSHFDRHGLSYPKFLESELRDILADKGHSKK